MIFLASINVELINLVLIGILIIIIGGILRYLKQPYIIAYIISGVLIGKHGLGLITNEEMIRSLGDFGLIILLFFIGMEISLPNFLKNWKIPTFGTLLQILGSIIMVGIIGWFFQWNINRIIIIGFIVSLSSSAVVIKMLQDNNESQSKIGQSIISILLIQDILIVFMLIISNYLGGNAPTTKEILLQSVGGLLIIGGIIWVLKKKEFTIPLIKNLKDDYELQVFIALIFCFGFAVITAMFNLSAALGAFLAAIFIHSAKYTNWVHNSLHSFRVIFVAIFFVSIGMLIDINFFIDHWKVVSLVLLVVYMGNHFINSLVLYFFGRNLKDSLYGGALLGQVGELSFILASSALYSKVISDYEYQLTITVISLTLFISPFWISATKKILNTSTKS